MSAREFDDYLANLQEPNRTTLQKLRQTILSIVPQAEQGIAYGCPAFRMHGKVVAGFAAFKNHLSYLPHSGSVFKQIPKEVTRPSHRSTAMSRIIAATSTGPVDVEVRLLGQHRWASGCGSPAPAT